MNGTLCADTVSRLPNEVSNYELCYFVCGAGCDRGKEGTERGRGGREEKEGMAIKRTVDERQKS